jgi:hypothetical protein
MITFGGAAVTTVHGSRRSLLLGAVRGESEARSVFLLKCFEFDLAQIVDGHMTLLVHVPDASLARHKPECKLLLQEAFVIFNKLIQVR